MDERTLEIFQRKAIKSKREVLEALEDYSHHLVHDKKHSSDYIFYRPALIELINRFIEKVCDCDLAYLEKPFACYEIVITNIDITLNSVEYTKIILDNYGEIESAESSEYDPIMIINTQFIPITKYAQRFSIDIETAVSWIKCRKIKCAEKRSSGWYVMETQGLPSEEYQSGSYIFIGESGDMSSIVSLCRGTKEFFAFRAKDDNGLFDSVSFDSNDRPIEYREINSKELYSIENALIHSQNVLFVNSFVEAISEKVVLGFKINPFLKIENEKIVDFVTHIDLPEETKNILKTIAKDNCGENLFVDILEKLSLKEEFLAFIDEATIKHKEKHSPAHFQEIH